MALGYALKTDKNTGITTSKPVKGLDILVKPVVSTFSPNESLTGAAKYTQLGLAVLLGNMMAVKATTDKYGVAVSKKVRFALASDAI